MATGFHVEHVFSTPVIVDHLAGADSLNAELERLILDRRAADPGLQRSNAGGDGWTGIKGIPRQDQAMTVSMGPIYDRTSEHLGTSDLMVIQTRRRLLDAAKAFERTGQTPAGVDGEPWDEAPWPITPPGVSVVSRPTRSSKPLAARSAACASVRLARTGTYVRQGSTRWRIR